MEYFYSKSQDDWFYNPFVDNALDLALRLRSLLNESKEILEKLLRDQSFGRLEGLPKSSGRYCTISITEETGRVWAMRNLLNSLFIHSDWLVYTLRLWKEGEEEAKKAIGDDVVRLKYFEETPVYEVPTIPADSPKRKPRKTTASCALF